MSPLWRYVLRSVFVGIVAAAISLKGNLPGISVDDLLVALLDGIIGIGAYAGIGAVTPLEPKVGITAAPKT